MSAFYDLASLVFLPSGYKSGKLYAQKPMTTDGQLTFTRASSATRVQSNGLIEKVRTNLLLRSQEFDNAYWAKEVGGLASAPVVTANAELAPDGTMTAERIVFNLNGSTLSAAISQIASATITLTAQENTGSVYLKTTDGTSKVFTMVNPDGTTKGITVTGTYQRFTNTSSNASASTFRLRLRGGEGTADSASIAAWGAQFESGVATDYIATTTAAVSVGPVSGLPRLDYLNSTCPKLLLEPQRTNLVTFSEQFDNANWTAGRTTITANTQVSPSGTISADTITDTITSGTHRTYNIAVISAVSGTAYATSCFIKAGTSNRVEIRLMASNESDIGITGTVFDLSNGTVVSGSGSIENYGNGWFRCTNMGTSNTTGAAVPFIYLYNSINQKSYLGTATNTLFLWGAQVEAGAYATSYIPTLGASVTRVADAASKTGISSLIGQTQGTIFFEWSKDVLNFGSDYSYFQVGIYPNYVGIYIQSTNCVCEVVNAGLVQASIQKTSVGIGTHKAAVAYANNDIVFYFDGVQVGTDTSATIPAVSSFSLNQNSGIAEKINQALLFKTRLSNAQLAELTAL